jgi:hypothetical protein
MIGGAMVFLIAALSDDALGANAVIGGIVTNQNNEPLERAQIRLSPGNVELVTGRDGRYEIVYLRDQTGERVKLTKRQEYQLEVFKVGFHVTTVPVIYKRGVLEVETVSLTPETLKIDDMLVDLDASELMTQANGNSKEGD